MSTYFREAKDLKEDDALVCPLSSVERLADGTVRLSFHGLTLHVNPTEEFLVHEE
jgi:hypothetical protein